MSFPIDSKAKAPSAPSSSIADEERATFGQQAPFAAVTSLARSPQGSIEHPQEHPDTLHQADQAPPPTYDEVTRAPGAPQGPNNNSYGDQPESSEYHSPSAPLLAPGAQGSNGYSSIPPPPPRSYASSVSSYASSTDRARGFNKFWIIFFAVVVILLIFDDDRQDEVCSEDRMMRRVVSNYRCSDKLVDFTINVSGVEGYITVEQDENAEKTLFFAEVFASDRDRLLSVKPSLEQSEEDGIFRSTTTNAKYQDPGCLYINFKIVFAGHHKQIRKLKFASLEGNITINMKDSQAEILELDSRLITGHSAVSAKVSKNAHIGGSVGSIRGDLVLGKEFTISMVQGPVVLNLAKAPTSIAMQGKVVVNQGNVTVGLVPHYRGVYTVEAVTGDTALQNIDSNRTVIAKQSPTRITGWNSEDRREPHGHTSELKVQTTHGNAILSFTPIELK